MCDSEYISRINKSEWDIDSDDQYVIELYYYSSENRFTDNGGFEINAYQITQPWMLELFFHYKEYMSFEIEPNVYLELFHDEDYNYVSM